MREQYQTGQFRTEQYQKEQFRSPGEAYRSIPFWSWNCKVTRELIDTQLAYFQEMGFGGVDIHPRIGLDTAYLGDEFMELVQYTVEQCREKGLICWLYDDDRYPSGAADGIVTKDVRYRDRGLLLTRNRDARYCANQVTFEAEIRAGKKPGGYFAGAYALCFGDGLLLSYERLTGEEEALRAAREGKCVRYAYVKLARESSSFERQTYVDTLNPEAVAAFIRVTHDRYDRAVGEEFGKSVQAVFTDEPRIGKQSQIAGADSQEDFEIPYSEGFAAFFEERCGAKLLDVVPALVWDLPDGSHLKVRWQYRDALCERFTACFMDQICDWCRAHHILMTGHVLAETPLLAQAAMTGECMRSYRKMDIPGIDVLCDDDCFVTAKQAASVARQMGRTDVMCELYGVTGWDCTFKTYKLQGDRMAALGITKRVPHLSFMSMAGEAKRDWPASISFQSPWYVEFSYIEDHFARLNCVLRQGKPVVHVALLHPIESVWLHMGQADRNAEAVDRMEQMLDQLTESLLFAAIDIDYLSEGLLPQQCSAAGSSATLSVGCMEYRTVVVPPMETIRGTTLDILENFRDRGGRIVFLENAPRLVDAEVSDRGLRLAERCESVASIDELVDALEQEREIRILDLAGNPSDNLFYQMREDDSGRWLFVCHVRERENGEERYTIQIRGTYTVRQYHTQTGEDTGLDAAYKDGMTCVDWCTYGEDSLLLRLEMVKSGQKEHQKNMCAAKRYETAATLERPAEIRTQEQNMLLLDYARYRLDGGALSAKEEILKLDDHIREQLGMERRNEHMMQPWVMEEGKRHKLQLYYEIQSETETPAFLALELQDNCRITLNGEAADMTVWGTYVDPAISVISLPALKKGRNELVVELDYHQKTNLEAMYLLGAFAVEIRENILMVKAWESELEFGDITAQEMPFYTGNLTYRFVFKIEEEGCYAVRVPEWKGPVMAVSVDGTKAGVIAYAPYRTVLGPLAQGRHELEICLYGNRYNGFGPLHNNEPQNKWIGPTAYRTKGEKWTDSYAVRPVGIMGKVIVERRLV